MRMFDNVVMYSVVVVELNRCLAHGPPGPLLLGSPFGKKMVNDSPDLLGCLIL